MGISAGSSPGMRAQPRRRRSFSEGLSCFSAHVIGRSQRVFLDVDFDIAEAAGLTSGLLRVRDRGWLSPSLFMLQRSVLIFRADSKEENVSKLGA